MKAGLEKIVTKEAVPQPSSQLPLQNVVVPPHAEKSESNIDREAARDAGALEYFPVQPSQQNSLNVMEPIEQQSISRDEGGGIVDWKILTKSMLEEVAKPASLRSNDELLEGSINETLQHQNSNSSSPQIDEGSGEHKNHSHSPSPSLVVVGEGSSSLSSNNDSDNSNKTGPPKVITTVSAEECSSAPKTSTFSSTLSSRPRQLSNLRRGKWTVEEETYVARVIRDFNSGFLDAPAGSTLRTYLSEKLQCDPMRITKKFTGDACIGKRVFHPAVRNPSNATAIDKAQYELNILERRWRRRLVLQQRESAKRTAASEAVVAVATVRYDCEVASSAISDAAKQVMSPDRNESVISRTASWLDRAKSVLKASPATGTTTTSEHILSKTLENDNVDLHTQIKEVQRLIHEGPTIEQTSAGLSEILDQAVQQQQQHRATTPPIEPADSKRMRTADDAEALVGFIRSVRASALSDSHNL